MSIDERLRAGLTANTAALTPALSDELDALGHRIRRRRRTRNAIYILASVSVVAAVFVWLPRTIEGLRERSLPSDRSSVPSPAPTPTPLSSLPEGSAVVPGRYAGEFPSTTRSGEGPLAVITIPAGYSPVMMPHRCPRRTTARSVTWTCGRCRRSCRIRARARSTPTRGRPCRTWPTR